MRVPFFYGWIVVAVAFVTMAIGVNTRTAFSLLFPPIPDEFGWGRGVTAGTISVGFLISMLFTPFLGRLMDRWGPRRVVPLGGGLLCAGPALGTLAREPWHLYLTLGVLVVGGSVCVGYTGHALFLPHWFIRRRGAALGGPLAGGGGGPPHPRLPAAPPGGSASPRGRRSRACLDLGRPLASGQRGGPGLGLRGLDPRPRHANSALLVGVPRILRRALRLVCRPGASDEVPDRDRLQPRGGGLCAGLRGAGRRRGADRPRPSVGPRGPRGGGG